MIDHALPGDAIAVTGLVKRFGSRTVLDSIDLHVDLPPLNGTASRERI